MIVVIKITTRRTIIKSNQIKSKEILKLFFFLFFFFFNKRNICKIKISDFLILNFTTTITTKVIIAKEKKYILNDVNLLSSF